MSVCDEGWGKNHIGDSLRCPGLEACGAKSWCKFMQYEAIPNGERPDFCPFAPILKALPEATPTAKEVAAAILTAGRFTDYAIAKGLARMIEVQKVEVAEGRE